MNDNSKKCFTELTKICILYSNIAKISMDESLNNVLSTDTGKSIANNNKITMERHDKDILKDILQELKNNGTIDKDYTDEDIDNVISDCGIKGFNIFTNEEV